MASPGMISGGMANQNCATQIRSMQICEQMASLENAISEAHQVFDLLASQMTPLLRQIDDKPANPCAPVPTLCPLAEQLRSAVDRLNLLREGMHRTRQHLEI